MSDYIRENILCFNSFEKVMHYMRIILANFKPHTKIEWHKLITDILR